MNNPFDLKGQTAIVTGASKGIGRSIAEHLAWAGAKVVISSRKLDACQEVVEAIRGAGGEATAIACNIGRKEQVEELVSQARETYGPIDIMVCNAAVNPYYGPLPDITDEAYHKIMDSNVLGAIWFAKLVQPDMVARGGGSFIIVSSVGSIKASLTIGAYCISKAADNQIVRNLAAEWGKHNIRVNALAPGLIKTDMARVLWDNDEARQRIRERFPIPRVGEPEDIGAAALFLASKAGAWMTGQTVVIDGGASIV